MTAMVAAVFLASLLGSLHCVGMCGAFLAVALGDTQGRATQAGYHGGRLVSYVVAGSLAGAIGGGLNVAGMMAGMRPVAMSLSAVAIIAMGLLTWLRLRGVSVGRWHGPAWMARLVSGGYGVAMRRPPVQRAMLIGLLTTLLPCGWLWTFLVTAAGTGRASTAALVMSVFWLGTLPAMISLGVGMRGLLGAAQRRVPTLTCLAMIAVGLFTLAGRWQLDPTAWAVAPAATQPVALPSDLNAVAPCCKDANADHH